MIFWTLVAASYAKFTESLKEAPAMLALNLIRNMRCKMLVFIVICAGGVPVLGSPCRLIVNCGSVCASISRDGPIVLDVASHELSQMPRCRPANAVCVMRAGASMHSGEFSIIISVVHACFGFEFLVNHHRKPSKSSSQSYWRFIRLRRPFRR